MKTKRNTKGLFLMTTGLLLIASALGLAGFNLWEANRAEEISEEVAVILKSTIEGVVLATPEGYVPDYMVAEEITMPKYPVNGYDYVGMLEIPCLGLKLPIINDWSYGALKCAPCRYTGSVYDSDMVIMAHNYRSHFARLSRVGMGERISFTDMDGNKFVYEAVELETLQATQIEEMTSGDWDMTLFTCTTGGQARVAVRFVEVRE